ncbi:unnamed protein product [Rangifer tarandus platyrhynchus]|uniref:Uncharacterized protein n=1 Tax=Rangifer tarandus platyrhynchus TaxID=3082113 RepID=A0AC59ZKN7_RANTA
MWSYAILMENYAFPVPDALGAVLVGMNRLVFWKEFIIEDSLSTPPYRTITFRQRLGLSVTGGGSFHLPHNLFHSTLLYSIHFSLPITVCFKNETPCYVPVENHIQERSQEDFLT